MNDDEKMRLMRDVRDESANIESHVGPPNPRGSHRMTLATQKESAARAAVALANQLDALCNGLFDHCHDRGVALAAWTDGKCHGAAKLMQDQLRSLACLLGLDAREAYALVEPKADTVVPLPPSVEQTVEDEQDGPRGEPDYDRPSAQETHERLWREKRYGR